MSVSEIRDPPARLSPGFRCAHPATDFASLAVTARIVLRCARNDGGRHN
jgi:hypothetical protein